MGNLYHFISIDTRIKIGACCLVVLFLILILVWKIAIGRNIMLLVSVAGICGLLSSIGLKYEWPMMLRNILNGISLVLILIVIVLAFLITKGVIKIKK